VFSLKNRKSHRVNHKSTYLSGTKKALSAHRITKICMSNSSFSLFGHLEEGGHEQVVFMNDKASGLRAIVAIHSTALGPALGGTRMWPYKSDEEALRDVLRLSRGMTYKNAVAGLNIGGGKAVIIGDPRKDKSEALFRTFGRFLEGLGGRYITAEDVGIEEKDMEWVRLETKYVTGIPKALGGSGDPSPLTALGVFHGMKACANKVFGSDSLKGKRVAIQGAGHVSSYLADLLAAEGAKIFIADIFDEKAAAVAARTGGTKVAADAIMDVECDVFSPCALGAILNDETIPRLKAPIVAGAANNQLAVEQTHGPMLIKRGILYAPDYVINAGGVISVASELELSSEKQVREKAIRIYDVITNIIKTSEELNIPTYQAANKLAEDRIAAISRIGRLYSSDSRFSGRMNLHPAR
jgi:leucine dehydrogenase